MSSSSSSAPPPSAKLTVCIDCAQEIEDGAEQCRLACGHQLHLSCYLRLFTNHGIAQCFQCNASSTTSTGVLLYVDMGQDANVRRLVREYCLMPASALTRATFTEHQTFLKPVDNSGVPPALLAMKDNPVVAPLIQRALGPEVSFTAQNSAEHVRRALERGCNMRQLCEAGITVDHVVAAGIHWRQWHDLGYGVRAAVELGAHWRNLLDMGFGEALAKYGDNDYHLLREPPLQVSFAQLLQDVFHNDYAMLAERRLQAEILQALGMQWDTLLRLKLATQRDLMLFDYIPLKQIASHLGVTKATMVRERFSLEFLQRMQWTFEQLHAHLRVTIDDLRSIYGNAFALIPATTRTPLSSR